MWPAVTWVWPLCSLWDASWAGEGHAVGELESAGARWLEMRSTDTGEESLAGKATGTVETSGYQEALSG